MEYLLMLYSQPATFATMTPAQQASGLAAYTAFHQAMTEAGVLRGSNRLRPAETATTVKVRDSKTEVLNGPYAETREELGGYYLIDVADLDAAMTWAARCPGASHGTVEVRPVWKM